MNKKQVSILAALLGIFLFAYFVNFASPKVQNAIMEAFYMLQWYVRYHTLACVVPAMFIAGAIATFFSKEAVLRHLGPKANTAMRQYLSGGADQGQKALSSREVQVLQQVVDGKTSREIAANLSLSVRTVDSHRANIMQKLSIRDVPGLTKYAIQSGLV